MSSAVVNQTQVLEVDCDDNLIFAHNGGRYLIIVLKYISKYVTLFLAVTTWYYLWRVSVQVGSMILFLILTWVLSIV